MNDSLLGRQVAGYRIDRLLGRGGMASVYFAWNLQLDRPVALKVMDERYRDTPSYVDRFVQEARAIAGWDQPNIVKVFDAGEEGGIYYYAMEFIRGLDLSQLLRQYLDARQLMPYNDVVRIGWAVANALDYAHAHGIIHRDVKPSNVLISVDGRVLLSDFGLVMDVNRGTMGETFGSPSYIAPEQARSSARAVPQSDNYSLGVMLYEMLTGQTPFHDPNPAALALKHLTEEPPRPRMLNPRLSPGVEAVLLRALRKRPEERYATGREMLSALEYALGNELRGPDAASPTPVGPETLPIWTPAAQNPPPRMSGVYPANPAGSNNTTAVGASALPRTEVRGPAYPPPPGSTQVRGVTPATSGAAVYTGQPQIAQTQAATSYPQNPANYGGAGYPPNAGSPPRRKGWFGWGCLAALVTLVVLGAFAGAAISAFSPNISLTKLLGPLGLLNPAAAAAATSTPQPSATAVPPTATGTRLPPTATAVPTATTAPTATTVPTAVPTATIPPATAVPTPAATVAPTTAPTSPNTAVYNMVLARKKQDGFVLENTSKSAMPVATLELWDTTNHLLVPGSAWGVDNLKPGECVSMWVQGVQPSLPAGYRCIPTGKVLVVAKDQRFWTDPVEIHYNGAEVYTCQPTEAKCGFDTSPQ